MLRERIKRLKIYQRVCTEYFYRLARIIGKNKLMEFYNPIIIGEENIPNKRGADVFVSNHRDIRDPLITIALLKIPVHFTALKRMFEYNENIFGEVGHNAGTVLTTFLVKLIGALPIARPIDDDYIYTNLQTFQYIHDYLKKKSAVAIYPEGTINREPYKNGNILPLKSNQAFKIGENGKGTIRPIAIVWINKEIQLRHKVIIAFLKPIETEGLKAREIAERWKLQIGDAINLMEKIIEEISKVG